MDISPIRRVAIGVLRSSPDQEEHLAQGRPQRECRHSSDPTVTPHSRRFSRPAARKGPECTAAPLGSGQRLEANALRPRPGATASSTALARQARRPQASGRVHGTPERPAARAQGSGEGTPCQGGVLGGNQACSAAFVADKVERPSFPLEGAFGPGSRDCPVNRAGTSRAAESELVFGHYEWGRGHPASARNRPALVPSCSSHTSNRCRCSFVSRG